jgi:hypothetical protein
MPRNLIIICPDEMRERFPREHPVGVKLDLALRLNEFALRADPDEPYLEKFTV